MDDVSDKATATEPHRSAKPIVIAHRGASGYVAEHTEAAKVLAIAQGADYVEQDLVLSKDLQLIVAHDIHLDATTNVGDFFPERRREDGKYYYADFTWAELRRLSVGERTIGVAKYAGRFDQQLDQHMMRFVDEVKLVQGLNRTLGKQVGLHVELKRPAWHLENFGIHPAEKLLPILKQFGYSEPDDRCFIQCFESEELKFLRSQGCRLKLIKLCGSSLGELLAEDDTERDRLEKVSDALSAVREYADGIGPPLSLLAEKEGGSLRSTVLVKAARKAGLVVHPYTVRADDLPSWAESTDQLHQFLIQELQVDGFFTDFPDLGRKAVDKLSLMPAAR